MPCWLILFALQFAVISAWAGTDEAMVFYEKKDYANAYAEFMRMAELGDHQAQFNVGVMYYRGEHVSQNVARGYAWMALSSQKSNKQWRETADKVYASFDEGDKKQADQARESLFEQYSDAMLAKQLAPEMTPRDGDGLRPIRRVSAEYPRMMEAVGQPGYADLLFTIGADGTTRNHSVMYATKPEFAEVSLVALKQWQYQPSVVNGKAVETYGEQLRMIFYMKDFKFDDKRIKSMVRDGQQKAEAGTSADRYAYGYFLQVLPVYTKIKFEGVDANRWFYQSAMEGYGPAQFSLARNLLYGQACTADTAKSLRWLQRAAEQGQPDAEYLLAIEMLNGVRIERDPDVAIKWLRKAAEAGNQHAHLKLAWLYATSADENQRNAALAKQYLDKMNDTYLDQRTLFEVRAAVAAAAGDFKAAVDWQKKANDETAKYELPMEAENEKLASYQAGKAWVDPI